MPASLASENKQQKALIVGQGTLKNERLYGFQLLGMRRDGDSCRDIRAAFSYRRNILRRECYDGVCTTRRDVGRPPHPLRGEWIRIPSSHPQLLRGGKRTRRLNRSHHCRSRMVGETREEQRGNKPYFPVSAVWSVVLRNKHVGMVSHLHHD